MAEESVFSRFSENKSCESEQRDDGNAVEYSEEGTAATLLENGNVGRILPTKHSEILPSALGESVFPYEDDISVLCDNSEKRSSTKKWYLQVLLNGVYAINNYLFDKKKTTKNSRGETVLYLNCTKYKYKNFNCRNGRAVLIIDRNGTKKIRSCCEEKDHNHPPPFAEIVKRNFKLKLKLMTERFPEKTSTDLYGLVLKEESSAYAGIDPEFVKFIPGFNTVRNFIYNERTKVRKERGLHYPLVRPKRKNSEYETVEVQGIGKSCKNLATLTSVDNNCSKEKEIKTETISSSDGENSCAEDPMESEESVPASKETSASEGGFDVSNSSASTSDAPFTAALRLLQQNNMRSKNSTTATVLQTSDQCVLERDPLLSSSVAPIDTNSCIIASRNQTYCDQLSFQSRFDLLAKNWSEKLKTLRNDQRIFAEKLINDVLYEAEFCLLNHSCRINNTSR